MSALSQRNEVLQKVSAAQATAAAIRGPAIDSTPLAGGEVTIKVAITPGMITLIASPATVLVTMLAGWVILTSLGQPVFAKEMLGGAIVITLGGVLASMPVFLLMKRGAQAIAQGAILGIAIRIGSVLMGLMLAMGPGWGLAKMPLVYWVLGYYFPLLIVETAIVGWLSHKVKH
jgi:hypothetical protein